MFCKLTPEEEVRMHILLKGIADDPNALEMQKFIQHGSVTTYEHCMRVTRIAFWLNIHLRAHADEASLVKGAFLHDSVNVSTFEISMIQNFAKRISRFHFFAAKQKTHPCGPSRRDVLCQKSFTVSPGGHHTFSGTARESFC